MQNGQVWSLTFVASKWHCVRTSQKCSQPKPLFLRTKWLKGGTAMKATLFRAWSSSVVKLCWSMRRTKKMMKSDNLFLDYRILQGTYVCECFCELFGSIILSACLVWSFVVALAIILQIHNWVDSKFPWPSLNRQPYRVLWYYCHSIFILQYVS